MSDPISPRPVRRRAQALLSWPLAAAMTAALVGAAAAQTPSAKTAAVQAPAPFTPAERAVILPALADCADGGAERLGALDDAGLRDALLRKARTELGQRIRPSDVDGMWSIRPPVRAVEAELNQARLDGRLAAWIASLAPKDPRYQALDTACRRYAGLVAAGGWEPLPPGGVLRQGDTDPQVPLLRLRLAREGFGGATAPEPELFDADLQTAVLGFQSRHGLEPDGVVGPRTRAALNVTAQARLQQIRLNMERWRWLPRPLPAERLEVDIAGQLATLFRAGAPVLAMKVVVGDPEHRTPMFASQVESILFNPPWNVPTSIATKEILPKAARDRGYLARNDFTFVDGRLVQKPGPKNALGVVKFDLPSPFGVYLHDTPGKTAFSRTDRALSHGCMRLEKPRELAALLLERQGGSAADVEAAIAAGETRRTHLATPVPLYVVYWTAAAEADGQASFRPDVYGWDAKLAQALAAADPEQRAALSRPDTDCASLGE